MTNWYKIVTAALIEAPPKMIDSVMKVVLEGIAKYKSTKKIPQSIKVPINLEGWKYGGNELLVKAKQVAEDQFDDLFATLSTEQKQGYLDTIKIDEATLRFRNGNQTQNVNVVFENDCKSGSAAWMPAFWQIRICLNSPHMNSGNISFIIEHELRHFSQSFLNFIKHGSTLSIGMKETGLGLPSKKIRTPQFEQESQNNLDNSQRVKNHALDDIEFYTDLGGVISEARKFRNQYKNLTLSDFIKKFTSQNWFFNILKQEPTARGKYQKAMLELYRSLSTFDENNKVK